MRYYELVETKIGILTIGEYRVEIDSHTIERSIDRFVSPRAVDRTLKKISQVGKDIEKIDDGTRFFIIDQTEGISLGIRKIQDKKLIFKTVVNSIKPYAKGVEDFISVK